MSIIGEEERDRGRQGQEVSIYILVSYIAYGGGKVRSRRGTADALFPDPISTTATVSDDNWLSGA